MARTWQNFSYFWLNIAKFSKNKANFNNSRKYVNFFLSICYLVPSMYQTIGKYHQMHSSGFAILPENIGPCSMVGHHLSPNQMHPDRSDMKVYNIVPICQRLGNFKTPWHWREWGAPAWHLKSTLDTGHSPECHSTEHISSIPHHCPLQVSELSRTSPDTALLQYRHCVLLHLPQSSMATRTHHCTGLTQLPGSLGHTHENSGIIFWGVWAVKV